MAKEFRKTFFLRMGVGFMRRSILLGLAPKDAYLLSVPEAETGRMQSTPVTVIEHDEHRWLVAPYGVTRWVRNARTAGFVELRRGRRRERHELVEVGPEEGAPVLREYVQQVKMVRPYFDIDADAPAAEFAAEVPRHPVFRLAGPAS